MSNEVKHPVEGYYEVTVVCGDEFKGCKDVEFNLFKSGAKDAELLWIARHTDSKPENGAGDVYWLSQFDMMFTLPEVGQIIEWFTEHCTTAVVRVYPAFAHNNAMSVSAMAVGGGDDFYMFSEYEDYTLPFKVWGYYNMRRYWETKEDRSYTFNDAPAVSVAVEDIPF